MSLKNWAETKIYNHQTGPWGVRAEEIADGTFGLKAIKKNTVNLLWGDSCDDGTRYFKVASRGFSAKLKVNYVIDIGSKNKSLVKAKEIGSFDTSSPEGSVINGSSKNDSIIGSVGWDVLDGADGDDIIHGGDGRDVLGGGWGEDQLYGGRGLNIFKNEKDYESDLIVILPDQYSGNNMGSASEYVDLIDKLDKKIDRIKIAGASSEDISLKPGVRVGKNRGVGIYVNDTLEALYVGGNLKVKHLSGIVDADPDALISDNTFWSY